MIAKIARKTINFKRAPPRYAGAVHFAIVHHTAGSNSYSRAQSAQSGNARMLVRSRSYGIASTAGAAANRRDAPIRGRLSRHATFTTPSNGLASKGGAMAASAPAVFRTSP